jgi:hypothetical protein
VRLRTEIEGGIPIVRVELCGVIGTTRIPNDDVRHDIAMAHALVMAWSEAKDTHCCSYREYDEFLKERTEEIMREWGLGED